MAFTPITAWHRQALFKSILSGAPLWRKYFRRRPETCEQPSFGLAGQAPNKGLWGISIFNGFGISALDHITVLAVAVPNGAKDKRPDSYSHALLASANLPREWEPAIGAIRKLTEILIGEDDELFYAKAYPAELGRANSRIKVKLLPNVSHMGMVYQPDALKAVAEKARGMLQTEGLR